MRQRTENIRYERKYLLPFGSVSEAVMVMCVQPAIFRRIHHPRKIRNIYFDTWGWEDKASHQAGYGRRRKFRVRWYGEGKQAIKPVIEIKKRVGLVGFKEEYPIPDFIPEEICDQGKYLEWCGMLPIPNNVRGQLQARRPVLENCYRREYWRSANGNYRVTIDSDIRTRLTASGMVTQAAEACFQGIVVELKYDYEYGTRALAEVGRYLPWRMTRHSKYLIGLAALH